MQPIKVGNQGQFVHDGQDMAKKEGFGHVSKLWYDKTISYDEGMELLGQSADSVKTSNRA